MPQSILILRKDIRHLLPELAVVLLLFVAFAFSAPSVWSSSPYATYSVLLAILLKVLMPVSWVVLISRLVHDEALVGDRQFWTSRPYHWAKLLAAKALFLALFLYLPFFLMQVYLLKHAGLHPLLALPSLGHSLLLLTACVVLPVTALASVTATFARLLLTVIGAALYVIVVTLIVVYLAFLKMQLPHLQGVLLAIFLLLPAIALIYQYKTRNSQHTRLLLLATPLVAALVVLLPSSPFIARAYPTLTGDAAPKLTSLTDQFHPPVTGTLRPLRNTVAINLPVSAAGVAEDVNFLVQGVRVTITGAGVHYTSPFFAASGAAQINAGSPATLIPFTLPLDLFNKIHTTPVDIHLELATEHLKAEKPQTWKATLLPFSIPGRGLCTFSQEDSTLPPVCRYALTQPEFSFVSAPVAPGACPSRSPQPITGRASVGGKGGTLDFDPVITVPLAFRTGDPNPQHAYVLCPGTDLSFVEAATLPNATLTVDQKQVILDPFAVRLQPPTQTPTEEAPQ